MQEAIFTKMLAVLALMSTFLTQTASPVTKDKFGSIYNPPVTTISGGDITTAGGMLAANNLSDVSSTSTSITNLGGLNKTNNLSDVSSTSTALTNLGGTTKQAVQHPIQWIIENATSTENDGVFIFNATSTINKVVAVNKTAGDTITFNLGYSNSMATTGNALNNLFSSNQTVTATTSPVVLTVNGSTTPATGNILKFWTTAASSSQFILTAYYNEN